MAETPSLPEIESLATALDELRRRTGALAERLQGGGDEGRALELFAVERALHTAARRLDRLV